MSNLTARLLGVTITLLLLALAASCFGQSVEVYRGRTKTIEKPILEPVLKDAVTARKNDKGFVLYDKSGKQVLHIDYETGYIELKTAPSTASQKFLSYLRRDIKKYIEKYCGEDE